MIQRLFVYGTLKPGHANAHLLEAMGGSWQAASVVGSLASEGWGARLGYPALVLAENGTAIHGFVFSSDHLAEHWQRLDEFEGDEYRRIVAKVKLEDQRIIEAYVYVLNEKYSGEATR